MVRGRPEVRFVEINDQTGELIGAQGPRTQRWMMQGLVLLTLAVLPWIGVIWRGCGFGVGDDVTVTQNIVLRGGVDSLIAIWRHPAATQSYRPVAYSLLMAQYHLWGPDHPRGYHAANIALHAANVLLFWWLLSRWGHRGALLAAALWAVFPANVDTVAWISRQRALWCAALCLGSIFVAFEKQPDGTGHFKGDVALASRALPWVRRGLVIVLFVGAMLCDIAAIVAPIVIVVVNVWNRGQGRRRGVNRWLGLAMLATGAVMVAGICVADQQRQAAMGQSHATTFAGSLLGVGQAITHTVWRILWPMQLSLAHRGYVASGVWAADAVYLCGAAIIACVTLAAIHALDRIRNQRLSEKLARMGGAAMIAVLVAVIVIRVPDYRNSEAMWQAVLRSDARSSDAQDGLGLIDLYENGNITAALGHFRIALENDPGNVQAHLHMAWAYDIAREPDKAIMQYYQALARAPDNAAARCGLAKALARQGHGEDAIEQLSRVLVQEPDYVLAHNELGVLHAQRGKLAEAAACYERAIGLDPTFIAARINLASVLFQQGRVAQAEQSLERAIATDPMSYEVRMNAGAMAGQLEDFAMAERFFEQALALRPAAVQAHTNIGIVQAAQGRFAQAVSHLERAIELDPNNEQARQNLENLEAAIRRIESRGR